MLGFSYMSGSSRKNCLHVFDLPDRSRISRGPFFICSVDNTTSFLEDPGCLCPGEIEDEISAG